MNTNIANSVIQKLICTQWVTTRKRLGIVVAIGILIAVGSACVQFGCHFSGGSHFFKTPLSFVEFTAEGSGLSVATSAIACFYFLKGKHLQERLNYLKRICNSDM